MDNTSDNNGKVPSMESYYVTPENKCSCNISKNKKISVLRPICGYPVLIRFFL